jgi:hypothetical protein
MASLLCAEQLEIELARASKRPAPLGHLLAKGAAA